MVVLKNLDLIDCWFSASSSQKIITTYSFVKEKLSNDFFEKDKLFEKVKCFNSHMTKYYKECKYKRKYFENKYKSWLNWEFYNQPSTSRISGKKTGSETQTNPIFQYEAPAIPDTQINISRKTGRPLKSFYKSTTKTKNRRIAELIKNYNIEELEYAVQKMKRQSRTTDESKLTPTKALSLYLDLDISEQKYEVLRKTINSINQDCLPSLHSLRIEKQKIIPPIEANEICAEVNLKTVLNKTAERLIELCDEKDGTTKLTMICKWGMDGSSGHSRYKQKFDNADHTDEFLFFIAFVPLKLVDPISQKVLWSNKTPSSTYYCRPIKFILEKENPALVRKSYNEVLQQIADIESQFINTSTGNIEVSFEMHCTMIDGAVTNILSNTNSTSRCFICNAKPTEMNNINELKIANNENYKYGLSALHCWIKFYECLLHISYRLSFKAWRIDKTNPQFMENKQRIQRDFKQMTGLIIDQVKTGYGNTNDGNTARRFFSNYEISSEITGIKKELIYNFYIILRVISCGLNINTITFKELLSKTLDIYLLNYAWYYMPSSVHKVLIHGCDIIHFFELPIGTLSEEAIEANHKMVRKARLSHTRISSRSNTNKDLMNFLLLSSDPVLTSMRNIRQKHTKTTLNEIEKYIVLNESISKSLSDESSSYDSNV